MTEAEETVEYLKQEIANRDASFELRWAADRRAIKRWQEAHPERRGVWPDHADMVVWLLETNDAKWQRVLDLFGLLYKDDPWECREEVEQIAREMLGKK